MTKGEKRKSVFVWILAGIGAFLYGPYVLGGVYAVGCLPFFSAVCGTTNAIAFVRDPPNYADYQTFLYGQGCKLPPPSIETNSYLNYYRPSHNFWSDDVISNLFANIASYWKRAFFTGAMNTASSVIGALRTNVMVRVLFYLVYILVIAIGVKLLGNAVDHVWKHFRERKSEVA